MPHDLNGNLIQVGDKILIPCKVESVSIGEEFCNVTLKTLHIMPGKNYEDTIVLNTKQVIKEG
jgi:hypothetical protein